MNQEQELAAFYEGGPRNTAEAFPPACLRTHWDPTMVVKHVLPDFRIGGELMDPRPAAKICFQYHHTSAGDAPLKGEFQYEVPPTPLQFLGGPHRPQPAGGRGGTIPVGGAASLGFPYKNYRAGVETDLLRVDEPLTKCAEKRYIPVGGTPAPSISTNVVPGSEPIQKPEVLDAHKTTGCRAADDAAAWARSDRLFFNPTRYDRTISVPPSGLYKAPSRHAASRATDSLLNQ